MKKFEFVLCALLAVGGIGHLLGTLTGYVPGTEVFIWSLTASVFVFVLVFLHVLRIVRPADRPVRAAANIVSVAWICLALAFGASVGNIADPRALMHAIVTLGLLITSVMASGSRVSGSVEAV
jgi:hypothetical protein